jgi:RNA polymerase sigma-70 factor (ECF subfamily)
VPLFAVEPSSSRSAGPSDVALVVSARAGEEWASETLYRRHVGTVRGLLCRLLGGDSEADDLVQDSFVTALLSLDRLAEPARFSSWVCGIAVRKTGKLLRRRRLLARLGLRSGTSTEDLERVLAPSAPPDVVADLTAFFRQLERLPVDARTAIVLRRVDGATLEEVADLMGVSLSTAKRLILRGEQRLRAFSRTVPGRLGSPPRAPEGRES